MSAPQLRRGESTKLTLAQAAGDVQADNEILTTYTLQVNASEIEDPRRIHHDTGNSRPGRVTSQASASPALDETSRRMPHLELSEEELDSLYLKLLAPNEAPLHDVACDEDDDVY